jgi:hypothetical protein
MSTKLPQAADALSDAILERMNGKPLDPAMHQQLRKDAANARDELRKKYGTSNIAVELIREVRQQCD